MDDKTKGHGWFLWSLVTVFSLLLLYPLSFPPVARLFEEGHAPAQAAPVVNGIYFPLLYVFNEVVPEWILQPYATYAEWWGVYCY